MEEAAARILLCGDALGRLNQLFKRVSSVNKSSGPFDALLCVGQYFPESSEQLDEFNAYVEGRSQIPIPTYFIGDYGAGAVSILSKAAKSSANLGFKMDGIKVCENLYWLRGSGKFTLHGLSVVYLSGKKSISGLQFGTYSQDDIDSLRALSEGKKSISGLQFGTYSQDDIDSLRALSEEPGTVDIFLTNEWPSGVTNRAGAAGIPSVVSDPSIGDSTVAEVVSEIKPRYHIAGTLGIYYDREPYINVGGGVHVTRFIALAAVGNKEKQKFIHALSLTPASKMAPDKLSMKPPNTTLSPYLVSDQNGSADESVKRYLESESDTQYWRYDVSKRQKLGNNETERLCFKFVSSGSCPRGEKCHFRHDADAREQSLRGVCFEFLNKGKCERGPDCSFKHSLQEEGEGGSERRSRSGPASSNRSRECWFCLSSPSVDSHLITSIGEQCYCALAKGPLVPDHVLIIPVEHFSNTLTISPDCEEELIRLQSSLQAYFNSQGKETVFFEWVSKRVSHANLQVVPIPSSKATSVEQIFNVAAKKLGFKFETVKSDNRMEGRRLLGKQLERDQSLFYVEVPVGTILFHVVDENEKFPVQFGREVLAGLLKLADKADWRNCQHSKDEETKMAETFKGQFAGYDPNA